jgi:hypothetical protein
MWKLILRAAIAVGQTEWARKQARALIDRLRRRAENSVRAVAATAGIGVPPADAIRQSRLIRTRFDTLKPGQVVTVDGQGFRIGRLISASAAEVIYEADVT